MVDEGRSTNKYETSPWCDSLALDILPPLALFTFAFSDALVDGIASAVMADSSSRGGLQRASSQSYIENGRMCRESSVTWS